MRHRLLWALLVLIPVLGIAPSPAAVGLDVLVVTKSDNRMIQVVMFGAMPSRNNGMAFDPDGFLFGDFLRNPILLSDHNLSVAACVGNVSNIHRVGPRWLADLHFTPRPDGWTGDWLPDALLAHFRRGVLAVSIDVDILEVRAPVEADLLVYGPTCRMIAVSYSMIELSVVAVGAIPDAVPVDRLSGIG